MSVCPPPPQAESVLNVTVDVEVRRIQETQIDSKALALSRFCLCWDLLPPHLVSDVSCCCSGVI